MKVPLLLCLLALPAYAEMDVTPIPSERIQEGITFHELRFFDRGKKVTYERPSGWTYSSRGPQKIAFYPPRKSQTKAEIETGNPVVPAQSEEEMLKQLRALILRLLPPESKEAEIVAEQKNPVQVHGLETYDITVAFQNYGQRYRMSVLFVNLEREQLRFKVIAEANDFEEAHRAFIASLFSLQWWP